MKTFIFCTSFMNNKNPDNNKYRYERWIDFYLDKMQYFGADYLFLLDDGSADIELSASINILDPFCLPQHLIEKVNLIHFSNNLGRPTHHDYQGWWRSFTYSSEIAQKYDFDKIIHIESDFFVVSRKMMDFIGNLTSGWTAFYSQFHNFPESALQVICKDAIPEFRQFYIEALKKKFKIGKSAELCLPFNKIVRHFCGDRLGQLDVLDSWLRITHEPTKLDYLGQVLPKFTPEDFEPFFEIEHKWK